MDSIRCMHTLVHNVMCIVQLVKHSIIQGTALHDLFIIQWMQYRQVWWGTNSFYPIMLHFPKELWVDEPLQFSSMFCIMWHGWDTFFHYTVTNLYCHSWFWTHSPPTVCWGWKSLYFFFLLSNIPVILAFINLFTERSTLAGWIGLKDKQNNLKFM